MNNRVLCDWIVSRFVGFTNGVSLGVLSVIYGARLFLSHQHPLSNKGDNRYQFPIASIIESQSGDVNERFGGKTYNYR